MIDLEVKSAAPTFEGLVAKMNEENRRCEEALKTGLRRALRARELLVRAKDRCAHDECTWLRENLQGSDEPLGHPNSGRLEREGV